MTSTIGYCGGQGTLDAKKDVKIEETNPMVYCK
jgi:hypothetical protein